jgi:hypothetical protein
MTDGYKRQGALLDVALALLPTPHGFGKDGQARRPGPTGNELGRAMTRLLPTPMARDGRPDGSQNVPSLSGSGTSLMKALLLPTPTGTMGEKRAWPEQGRSARTSTGDDLATALSTGVSTSRQSDDGSPSSAGLHLNPSFVEWMMGAPFAWSDPDCPLSATEFSSRPAGSAAGASSNTQGSL